ncbi:MAG: response regulator [bacterium]|nr:response regulator [bacterium]
MNRVLVTVDDHILTIVQIALHIEGYNVDRAENGKQTLEMIKQNEYDILISDIHMPEIDGIELAHKAKVIQPELHILLISGHNIESSTNGWRILRKPFRHDDLLRELENL